MGNSGFTNLFFLVCLIYAWYSFIFTEVSILVAEVWHGSFSACFKLLNLGDYKKLNILNILMDG